MNETVEEIARRTKANAPGLATAVYDGSGVRGPDALRHINDSVVLAEYVLAVVAPEPATVPVKVRVVSAATLDVPKVEWPAGWPIPSRGQAVGLADWTTLWVRDVAWFPQGQEESGPFVYLVLGDRP